MADAVDKPWLASESAQAILLGIACVESNLLYTRQMKDGPARSLFQCEPFTARDVIKRRIRTMEAAIAPFIPPDVPVDDWRFVDALQHSQPLGCCVARLKLMDDPRALPSWHEVEAQAAVWKRVYNTELGAGRPDQYVSAFARHKVFDYLEGEFGAVVA
jgi:hypothetical protein